MNVDDAEKTMKLNFILTVKTHHMTDELIPPELAGKNTNLESIVELETGEESEDTFIRAYKRMLNPAIWHKLCGKASAEFILFGDDAAEANRLAKQGDYFRIDIPGPGPSSGDGYDWVKVELVEEGIAPESTEEFYGMKLRATAQPNKEGNDTAHFFTEDATSSFVIHRTGNRVKASYHGRNEVPNKDTEKKGDNIRNAVVAMGALSGLSELHWSALIKGFLEKEIGG